MTELGSVLELVHGGPRYRTLSAVVRHTSPSASETGRLWVETPSRRRWEVDGRERKVTLVDGERGFSTDPYGRWNPVNPRMSAVQGWERLAEPWPLLCALELEIGDRVRCAGRKGLRVRGSGDHPAGSFLFGAVVAARCEFTVDLERGVLLRLKTWDSRGQSEEWELVELSFDEPLPASLFAPPDLDRQQQRGVEPVELGEVTRRVPFTIFVPPRLPDAHGPSVYQVPARGAPYPREERVAISYRLAGGSHFLHLVEAGQELTTIDFEYWGGSAREWVDERDGQRLTVFEFRHPGEGDMSICHAVRFEEAGTHVQLTSELELETLTQIALSLEPLRPDV